MLKLGNMSCTQYFLQIFISPNCIIHCSDYSLKIMTYAPFPNIAVNSNRAVYTKIPVKH